MLGEVCKELNNWFNYTIPKKFGTFVIADGQLVTDCDLLDGQFFRIVGSVLNDGVYEYPATELNDETFEGAVWGMAVPPEVVALADEIKEWQDKYGGVDSAAMSPFTSESFGGYSYTKGRSASSSGGDSSTATWQSVFKSRLNKWRKLPPY